MQSPYIVGILNVTPDSYFDGGQNVDVDSAVRRAGGMLQQGADIIEIGGESTGPGSRDVSAEEELNRVLPVVEGIRSTYSEARISVDTYKAKVASKAIAAGAMMINDVTAGRGDPTLFAALAKSSVPVILMYSKDPSARTTKDEKQYEDVVQTVASFLRERIETAEKAGISRDRIILDPGMGHFVSSDSRYSYELLARLPVLRSLGCPLFVSASRKSFLAGSENLPAVDRLPGTIAASAIAVLHGVQYIRTHDVLEVRRGCEVAAAVSEYLR